MLAAINGKECDRVPFDLGGYASSMHDRPPYGYRKLCEYLGISDVAIIPATGRRSHVVFPMDERILRRFDIDLRTVKMNEPCKKLSSSIVEDSWGVKWKETPGYYHYIDPPLAKAKNSKEIEDYLKWPDPKDPTFISGKREEVKNLREAGDFAISADLGPVNSIFHRYACLRGFDRWLVDMMSNPDLYGTLADKILEVNTDIIALFLGEVGEHIDIVCIADDMGSNLGPFMSVQDYRKHVKPWLRNFVKLFKKSAPAVKVFYHCDGAVHPLISNFIDCGIDILNPIQPGARDMEPERLKREFGSELCFHGGIDVQKVLPSGTPKEVENHVRSVLEVMAPGGRYILAPSHYILEDVPPENIFTMYSTALEHFAR